FQSQVVVDAAVRQKDRRGVGRALQVKARARNKVIIRKFEDHRRKERRKRGGCTDGYGELYRWIFDFADAVVPSIGLAEAPEYLALDVRCVKDEAWGVGKVLERGLAEKVIAVRVGDGFRYGLERV